jgi:hypothetical protein
MIKNLRTSPSIVPGGEPVKRRGGWPKGKPRAAKTVEEVKAAADRAQTKPSLMSKMKSRPNWESDDFVGVGLDAVDLGIGVPSRPLDQADALGFRQPLDPQRLLLV